MKMLASQKAFTLIELMVSIVVVSLMASVSLQGYKKYKQRAMKAEAYLGIDAIAQTQRAFFLDHDQYLSIYPNGGPTRNIEDDSSWQLLGYPLSIGSKTTFEYMTYAGKYDNAGAAIPWWDPGTMVGDIYGPLDQMWEVALGMDLPGVGRVCGISGYLNQRPFGYGMKGAPGGSYTWALIIARAPLNLDSECTYIFRLIEESPNQSNIQGKPPLEIKVVPGGSGEYAVG